MKQQERELLVARICSGSVRFRVRGDIYVVRRPSSENLYIGHEVYAEYLEKAHLLNLFKEDELLEFMVENDLWDAERSRLFESLPKEIDQFKVALYKSQFKSKEKAVIRKALAVAKAKMGELFLQREAYEYLSCSGTASLARSRYLVGSSAFFNNKPLFSGNFWNEDSQLLEEVMVSYSKSRISESSFREMARTEPWRSIWSTHKVESSLFGIPAADYTEEQRSLVCWSIFYDNIYSHPNCPAEDVITDDDVLDGWAIEQKRLRDAAANGNGAEELVKNAKIRESQEVYLLADTHEDARNIDALNSEVGSMTKKQRFQALSKAGTLHEIEMPDTAKRLRQEVTKRLSAAIGASVG